MSQKAFWVFLATSQKNDQNMPGKCPGAGAGAGKMSRKCQKHVPQTFSRHFFANREPKGGAWVAAEGRHLSICQKMSKKVWKGLGDIFLTFSKHFSSASSSTRTFSRHFLDIFLGGCQEAPKGLLGHFFDIFRQFLVLALLRVNNITTVRCNNLAKSSRLACKPAGRPTCVPDGRLSSQPGGGAASQPV